MHSNIIQVSPNPIAKEDYITELDFTSDFVPRIGDYVCKVAPEELPQIAKNIFAGDDIFDFCKEKGTVTIKDKKRYFEKKYNMFKTLLKEIVAEVTLKSFSGYPDEDNGLHYKWYLCNQSYDATYEFYICETREDCPVTLDEWMRSVEDGDTFYIGGALDYHY